MRPRGIILASRFPSCDYTIHSSDFAVLIPRYNIVNNFLTLGWQDGSEKLHPIPFCEGVLAPRARSKGDQVGVSYKQVGLCCLFFRRGPIVIFIGVPSFIKQRKKCLIYFLISSQGQHSDRPLISIQMETGCMFVVADRSVFVFSASRWMS